MSPGSARASWPLAGARRSCTGKGTATAGSRLVLDYRYPRRLVSAAGLALVKKIDRFVERRGEPMLSAFSPEEFAAQMERAGFVQMDHVSPQEQVRRYLQGRHDIPAPPPNFAFALFSTK